MKKYSMTFDVLKSSDFHRCSANCHLVYARRKVNIPLFTIWNSRGFSVPEVILGRIHTSLRVFTTLRQFKEMDKSPQIMGMNKQIVLQNLHLRVLHRNWSFSSSKIM